MKNIKHTVGAVAEDASFCMTLSAEDLESPGPQLTVSLKVGFYVVVQYSATITKRIHVIPVCDPQL